jgi:hypothetical protein
MGHTGPHMSRELNKYKSSYMYFFSKTMEENVRGIVHFRIYYIFYEKKLHSTALTLTTILQAAPT